MAAQQRTKVTKTLTIKLGSAVAVDANGSTRRETMRQLGREVHTLQEEGWGVLMVVSGAVSRGKAARGLDQSRGLPVADLQAISAIGQGHLFREVAESFSLAGTETGQMLLTFSEVSDRDSYPRVRAALTKLLEWRVVPVLNENDSVTSEGVSFGNNDFLAAQVAALLGSRRLVFLSSVEGVMDDDPRRNDSAEVIPTIDDIDLLLEETNASRLPEKSTVQGRGGIRGKLRAAQLASLRDIPVVIGSLEINSLRRLAVGTGAGTFVNPSGELKSQRASFRFWLEHALPSAGAVIVDEGAAAAIRRKGASLLAVGVSELDGDFAAGDAVRIEDQERNVIAKGICRYGSRELRLLQSAGWKVTGEELEEVVHRDEMVLKE
jgi:glutamate 5-kinase